METFVNFMATIDSAHLYAIITLVLGGGLVTTAGSLIRMQAQLDAMRRDSPSIETIEAAIAETIARILPEVVEEELDGRNLRATEVQTMIASRVEASVECGELALAVEEILDAKLARGGITELARAAIEERVRVLSHALERDVLPRLVERKVREALASGAVVAAA